MSDDQENLKKEKAQNGNKKSYLTSGRKNFGGGFSFCQMFSSLIISLLVTIVALGVVFFSSSWWSKHLLPDLQRIDTIQQDMAVIQARFDQVTEGVNKSFSDTSQMIEDLQKKINDLQKSLEELKNHQGQTALDHNNSHNLGANSKEVKYSVWFEAKNHFKMGEVCQHLMKDLGDQFAAIPLLQQYLLEVVKFSESPAKTMDFLVGEFKDIAEKIGKGSMAQSPVVVSVDENWLKKSWNKISDSLSKWIRIKPLLEKPEKMSMADSLDLISKKMEEGNLVEAIKIVEQINSDKLPNHGQVENWLELARARLANDLLVAKIDEIISKN